MARMKDIQMYLDAHKNAWAPNTLKAEESRLRKYAKLTDPASAYAHLTTELKPYTIKILFIRLSHFEQWRIEQGLEEGPSKFKQFLKSHANKFKHVYDRKEVDVDYDTALQRIRTIADQATREHAEFLLRSGLRISESYKVQDGQVVGKGGRPRKVYSDPPKTLVPQHRLRGALARLGLKPHDLRKLLATKLVRRGADAATLCHVMGWSKIETAYRYIQPMQDSKIEEMLG